MSVLDMRYTPPPSNARRGRDLLSPDTFRRLTDRIDTEHHLGTDMSERIVDQACAFLAACAATPDPLAPSMAVDIGWHTFILHTRDYATFCQQVAGHFIHHVPDPDGTSDPGQVQALLDQSATAIADAGYAVDPELWHTDGALKCNQCHTGCADDPPPIPPFRQQ